MLIDAPLTPMRDGLAKPEFVMIGVIGDPRETEGPVWRSQRAVARWGRKPISWKTKATSRSASAARDATKEPL
jgi:hypothetical protein